MKSPVLRCFCAALVTTGVYGHNSVTFVVHDQVDRIVAFDSNPGFIDLPNVKLPGGVMSRYDFPDRWSGAVMAKLPGSIDPAHRIIAEINFKPGRMTLFDISAMHNLTDNSGIRHMHPINSPGGEYLRPGCDHFPCANCYLGPKTLRVRATYETDFIIEVGSKY
ncbi:hypothetical protein DSL72_007536 [Monilinia vaccinii-corymbosi]|uniref:Aldose 1-epimerase n=1 Tax=Monilinia vaccinii-corymbosi TaxID=61207 RepID=A0A8A3PHC4_9HELO|nr:hypothetical protein DSL72_007536 [Monilinia vaccinii-corymbosi]